MMKRDKYLNQLIRSKNNGFPKVITGVRRCGKSYLLEEIFKNYLLDNGVSKDDVMFLKLDDDTNASLRNPLSLGSYVREWAKGKNSCYVILDEIQRVFSIVNPELTDGRIVKAKKDDEETISFVDVVLGLSGERNIDLYVTGSNSKMLSTEIVTQFRDKATNIQMQPLSFEEFYDYKKGSSFEAMQEYMLYGGMPLAILKGEEDKKEYLINLYRTTYLRDILEHNKIKKVEALEELGNILSSCIGSLINPEKVANTYRSVKHELIDKETVLTYINYFKDAFLIREAKRYDVKGREEIGALKKYYFIDCGLRNARLNFAYSDEGQLLENVIYNELIYKGYSVNIGTFQSYSKDGSEKTIRMTNEIDFYAIKGNRHLYIQACSNFESPETRAREIKPYLSLNDQVQKIVVINKPIPETRDENGFTIIGITDFLLKFIWVFDLLYLIMCVKLVKTNGGY